MSATERKNKRQKNRDIGERRGEREDGEGASERERKRKGIVKHKAKGEEQN